MTEFKPGDIVRLTKGEPDKPGYGCQVREVSHNRVGPGMAAPFALRACERDGWTVELISRPAPPLPTKPGTLGWATVDGGRCIVRRNAGGTWSVYDEIGFAYAVRDEDLSDFEEAVLIPKKLADEVMEWADDDHRRGWCTDGIMQKIADHLKGQDDE